MNRQFYRWLLSLVAGALLVGAVSGFTTASSAVANTPEAVPENISQPALLTVNKSGDGTGTVISDPAGIDCGADCQQFYEQKQRVTLTAIADPGSVFVGWDPGGGPGCPGTETCSLNMATDKTVTATFAKVSTWPLSVTKTGAGAGTVSSSPSGIDCGSDCTHSYLNGAVVTLSATAAPGSTFTGWSGSGCSGTGSCSLTIDQAREVQAQFDTVPPPPSFTLAVTKTGSGQGTVSSLPAGIDCGPTCSASYQQGLTVTLSANPQAGSTFVGWSGSGCSGTGSCSLTIDQAREVQAQFDTVPPPPLSFPVVVSKSGDGQGTVSSTPVGIDCGADCTQSYLNGTVVTLSASAAPGSTFTGWSGSGCSGTGSCSLTVDQAREVQAVFTAQPEPQLYELRVDKRGSGQGRVTASPGDIDCGPLCSALFVSGTQVVLTATAENNDLFTGWSGPCQDVNPCIVTVDQAKTVTAIFELRPPPEYLVSVSKNGAGDGRVQSTPNGISCGQECAATYPLGTGLTLQAQPDYASQFQSWNGNGCQQSSDRQCQVEVDERKNIDAIFTPKPGGGAWARKYQPGLNTIINPRRSMTKVVKASCQLGDCQIRKVDVRLVIHRKKYRQAVNTSWSPAPFSANQQQIVKARLRPAVWRQLKTRKSGVLVVSIGITAAEGRRAVTREIKIGIRR